MNRFLKFYIPVFLIVFIVNFIRYIRCVYYQAMYNKNLNARTPFKNYSIKHFAYTLLRKGDVEILNSDIDIITNQQYQSDFNNAFENAKGYFKYLMWQSLIWPWLIIKTFKIFAPIRKISNKFSWVILAPLEMFVAYLLGLFLDTTGIGNKILDFLLDFLSRIFPNIS